MGTEYKIGDFLGQLKPAKGSYYVCPACGEGKLSVNSDGQQFDCYACHDTSAIWRALVPRQQSNSIPGTRPRKRVKSRKEKDRDVHVNALTIENKVEELFWMVEAESCTAAEAGISLSTWCKEYGHDRYAAGILLRERLERLKKPAEQPAPEPQLLETAIDRLIAQEIDGSTLTLRLTALANECRKPLPQVEKIYYQRRKETEATQATQDAAQGLNKLDTIRQALLPLEAGLHGDGGRLAWQLRETAKSMPTAPEFLATTLIPVLASRIGTSQTLIVSARAGYTVRPIFRTMVVAPTGRKKTPAQKSIISALNKLESIHYETYRLQYEQYEQELTAWKHNSSGDEPKPTPPTRRRFVSTDDTLAARIQIHSENPLGLLLYRDEGSAFITERGRFSSGRSDGGETEADLSEFNGGALSRDRKTDGSTFLAKTGISRTGATQYAKLQRLMGDHQDDCGEWARYLFCLADAPPSYLDLWGDDTDPGLQDNLISLIQRLDALPERSYILSDDAKLEFMGYQHMLTDRAMETDHPAMAAALPKFETYFGRFCLLLHVVNTVLAGEQPATTVEAHTVELAQQWTEHFVGQFELLLALNSPQQELTGDLLRLRDYIERRPNRTIRQLVQAKFGKTAQVKTLVSTLVEQGHIAEMDGTYSIVGKTVETSVELTQQSPTPVPTSPPAPGVTPPLVTARLPEMADMSRLETLKKLCESPSTTDSIQPDLGLDVVPWRKQSRRLNCDRNITGLANKTHGNGEVDSHG
ncbi:DUF3987 domain-containing protein [Leptolyngbyaceae cyanobacterium CCMR0082]|uniref:DUF3987 domain-containing protein n=1 Tax=Adonisia turfae CCMR0082 TaxID=2304604 RepID=A0A6M0S728_9CYAN|nr:DUF3987 domain-containing protein [Adonisia turfae]NEZ64160.1 DUF3987 domain-containing protein [Adonisia turfae CCMR0082]